MLHVAHAAKCNHRRIQVRTVDTNVVVSAVMVTQPRHCHVWMNFGLPVGWAKSIVASLLMK